jgi:hypothetical protein
VAKSEGLIMDGLISGSEESSRAVRLSSQVEASGGVPRIVLLKPLSLKPC